MYISMFCPTPTGPTGDRLDLDIFRATSMGFSGSLSSIEAETSQVAPGQGPRVGGALGNPGLPVVRKFHVSVDPSVSGGFNGRRFGQ